MMTKVDSAALRRGARRDSKEQLIIEAASQLFVEEGFVNFGSRAAAGRAGLRLSTLQYYFPTTEALLDSTVRSLMDRYLTELLGILTDQSLSPEKKLSRWVDFNFEEIRKKFTSLLFFEVWAVSQRNALVRAIVTDTYTRFQNGVADLVADFQPGLSLEQRLQRAALMISQTDGLILFTFEGGPSVEDPGGLREGCFQALMRVCTSP